MSTLAPHGGRAARAKGRARDAALILLVVLGVALLPTTSRTARAAQAPVGQGFTVTPGDLKFILEQIKIGEHHAITYTATNMCGTLVGPGPDQIPDRLTSYGLRTVDGSCNNLFPGRERFATADQPFPRLAAAAFRDAEAVPPGFGPPGPTSYAQTAGNVFDSRPRTVSNLIVDQTSTNPAAVAAAAHPVRAQGGTGIVPCTTDPAPDGTGGVPAGCVRSHHTLFIPNVTTDDGLSAPYNSLFTFFGQFFDHGVDQTVKSGGAVFVPLKPDDPLVTLGPDGEAGTGDEVPPSQAFMVLTRAQNQPGPDGKLGTADDLRDATNTDSPWVDQSQTYASHASHQVFLREYDLDGSGRPAATGNLLGDPVRAAGPDGVAGSADDLADSGMATWRSVKAQAAGKLGLLLRDRDVSNVPMLAADPYGKFIPGPHGLPQYVTKGPDGTPNTADDALVEGDLAHPVPVPDDVVHFDTPFITDIAHNADPGTVGPCTGPGTPPDGCLDPDPDQTASADFAGQPSGTYDDEMLDAHFSAGDGRVNENIALTTVHQVFHSEHDRLVADIRNVLESDTSPAGRAFLAQWQTPGPASADGRGGYGYGERLFQAARFINEMEYQHLVFEEFARKMQPAVRAFRVYHSDIDPAIPAEFAHAVYRFGHSMLDDDVARSNEDPAGAKRPNDVKLLDAFLNPPEYFHDGASTYTPEQAAGAIVMGSSDQVGNEIDEFVTETLRNNLLGLPLDLAAINMTRAREAGVPPLNVFRRRLFARTSDAQLAPYASWTAFGQHLKHPESLVNFVAAYGRHPSILDATTIEAKRAAARAIVDPAPGDVAPPDAGAFMFSTGAWANADGGSVTGLDDVDLWVGGLAEVTNLNGGLLGSTFNYVFQNTLENLQDADRLYYLARTPGLNLRAQLEGNSFAELIQRNTDGTHTLRADAFATANCKFELANLAGTPAAYADLGPTVADDPTTQCDEHLLLVRQPDGTIQYRARNTVDPAGINGQSVYNGIDDPFGIDRIFAGNDDDTVWGGAGDDVIEGNGGDDVLLGGAGNDIVTDLDGLDTLKGGPGNDALNAGPGNDIVLGGDGKDFINGGANDNETFAGEGTDFVNAGQGADVALGDGGDDWIQGGSGRDFLHGDHEAPFFDDPGETKPGNDVFVGQVGDNDYDAEGGDDLMAQNSAVDSNAGAAGFDWAFHQYDTVGADDDMKINQNQVGLPQPVIVNRDRWQETEADSGSAFNDVLRGDDTVPSTVGGGGFIGCDVLDQAGVDRIAGLAAVVPALSGDASTVEARSATGACPLSGPFWGAGNILVGGGGSDTIEGRGADDVIDGDRALRVRISVRAVRGDAASETGTTDLMEGLATTGSFGPGTAGMTLQEAVLAGKVDPGNLAIVRDIPSLAPPAPDCGAPSPKNCDTAVFSAPRANYRVTPTPDGLTVAQVGLAPGQTVSDGTDTLRGIERLKFSDQTITLGPDGAEPPGPTGVPPAAGSAAPGAGLPSAPPASADTSGAPAQTAPGPRATRHPAVRLRATSVSVLAPAAGPVSVAATLPAGATTVQLTLLRRAGGRLVRVATVFRRATAGRHRFRLTERAVRRLRPGAYVVRVRVGTSRLALGPPVQRAFVKRARPGRG